MASRRTPPPTLYLQPGEDEAMRPVVIGEADGREVVVPATFFATFDVRPAGVVTLEVAAARGRARVTSVHIAEAEPGAGVTGLAIDSLPLARLLTEAVQRMAWLSSTAGLPGTRAAAAAATRRRRRVSDERLEDVAAAYARGRAAPPADKPSGQAGIEEVMGSEKVSERQAYRLVERARDAGKIAQEDDRG